MRLPSYSCSPAEQRVPAGALALVLVLSIVISAILLGLIGFYAFSYRLIQAQNRQMLVQRNARSGLAYVLASPALPYFTSYHLDLFGTGTDSVQVNRRPWGLFDIATVIAHQGTIRDTLVALIGSRFASVHQGALYLPNTSFNPVGLAGKSRLIGSAYLPARGARAVYLPGHQIPSATTLVSGATHVSAPQLPLDADSAFRCLRDYATLSLSHWVPANARVVRDIPSGNRSFGEGPLVWQQQKPGSISGITVSGQVILTSLYPVVLDSLMKLDGVLVMAPKITVASGFRGRVQLFARDTIAIQERAQLLYPSVIAVFSASGTPTILLGKDSFVGGVIIAGAPAANTVTFPLVQMHALAQVEGQIYTTGTLLNCGQVTGTVMCQQVTYQFSPQDSRYLNYLVDAVINRDQLPTAFLTSPWINPGAPRDVLQWLSSHK